MAKSSSKEYKNICFSGHNTFPLKLLWPYKIYHYFRTDNNRSDKGLEAMQELGLGSNMVSSAIFWAKAIGIIDKNKRVTQLGELIFGTEAQAPLDRYGDKLATLYLYHWRLANNSEVCTTIAYLFQEFDRSIFTRENLKDAILNLNEELALSGSLSRPASEKTISSDVDTILRMYCPSVKDKGKYGDKIKDTRAIEEIADYIFLPAKLITFSDKEQQSFKLIRTRKDNLSDELFAFCLLDFWKSISEQLITLDFEDIRSRPRSPGMIFRLDEQSLLDYLSSLSELTGGMLEWSSQTGINQVVYRGSEPNKGSDEISSLCSELLIKALKK